MAYTPCPAPINSISTIGTTVTERGLTTQQFKDKFGVDLATMVAWLNTVHLAEDNAHQADDVHVTTVHGLKIESGTFVPTITDGTNGPSACTTQSGYYQKIGTTVFFHLAVVISIKGSAMVGGVIYAGGLPFACINNASRYSCVSIGYAEKINIGSGKTLVGNIAPGASRVSLYICPNDNTNVSVVSPAMIADGTQLFISGQYQTS